MLYVFLSVNFHGSDKTPKENSLEEDTFIWVKVSEDSIHDCLVQLLLAEVMLHTW